VTAMNMGCVAESCGRRLSIFFSEKHTASIFMVKVTRAAGTDYPSTLKLEAVLLCP
jgi:hypothetical protein